MNKCLQTRVSCKILVRFDISVFCLTATISLFLCAELCFGEKTLSQRASLEQHPVALSSLIVDLKYNKKQGIKIVELQQTSISALTTYDSLYGEKGLVAKKYCDILSQFLKPVWFIYKDVYTANFLQEFINRQWFILKNIHKLPTDPLFLNGASSPVSNPHHISSYHGILFAMPRSIGSIEKFRKKYPGIIIFDLPTFPYWTDKYKMNALFSKNENLTKVRPIWNNYPKKYSSQLVERIEKEIPGDIAVIKPRGASRGRGVIIVKKKDLKNTLKRILIKPQKLKHHHDTSYSHWARDTFNTFLVEEFIHSDPIQVSYFDNLFFDATMRVVFLLIYDQQEIRVEFIESHWKLPDLSLSEKGSLNDKHKSSQIDFHYDKVAPDLSQEVEKQLRKSMIPLYQEMLSNGWEE